MDLMDTISSLNIEKQLLLLLFFIPGFISIKIYDLFIPGERRDFSRSIVDIFVYSSINYVLSSWLIYLNFIHKWYSECFFLFALSFIFIVFLLPVILPVLFHRWLTTGFLSKYSKIHPTPVAWDFFFGKQEKYWIILHLKDGRKIGGYYGENSFASSFPHPEEIYLEELWALNKKNKFIQAVSQSAGALVSKEDIELLEFFKI